MNFNNIYSSVPPGGSAPQIRRSAPRFSASHVPRRPPTHSITHPTLPQFDPSTNSIVNRRYNQSLAELQSSRSRFVGIVLNPNDQSHDESDTYSSDNEIDADELLHRIDNNFQADESIMSSNDDIPSNLGIRDVSDAHSIQQYAQHRDLSSPRQARGVDQQHQQLHEDHHLPSSSQQTLEEQYYQSHEKIHNYIPIKLESFPCQLPTFLSVDKSILSTMIQSVFLQSFHLAQYISKYIVFCQDVHSLIYFPNNACNALISPVNHYFEQLYRHTIEQQNSQHRIGSQSMSLSPILMLRLSCLFLSIIAYPISHQHHFPPAQYISWIIQILQSQSLPLNDQSTSFLYQVQHNHGQNISALICYKLINLSSFLHIAFQSIRQIEHLTLTFRRFPDITLFFRQIVDTDDTSDRISNIDVSDMDLIHKTFTTLPFSSPHLSQVATTTHDAVLSHILYRPDMVISQLVDIPHTLNHCSKRLAILFAFSGRNIFPTFCGYFPHSITLSLPLCLYLHLIWPQLNASFQSWLEPQIVLFLNHFYSAFLTTFSPYIQLLSASPQNSSDTTDNQSLKLDSFPSPIASMLFFISLLCIPRPTLFFSPSLWSPVDLTNLTIIAVNICHFPVMTNVAQLSPLTLGQLTLSLQRDVVHPFSTAISKAHRNIDQAFSTQSGSTQKSGSSFQSTVSATTPVKKRVPIPQPLDRELQMPSFDNLIDSISQTLPLLSRNVKPCLSHIALTSLYSYIAAKHDTTIQTGPTTTKTSSTTEATISPTHLTTLDISTPSFSRILPLDHPLFSAIFFLSTALTLPRHQHSMPLHSADAVPDQLPTDIPSSQLALGLTSIDAIDCTDLTLFRYNLPAYPIQYQLQAASQLVSQNYQPISSHMQLHSISLSERQLGIWIDQASTSLSQRITSLPSSSSPSLIATDTSDASISHQNTSQSLASLLLSAAATSQHHIISDDILDNTPIDQLVATSTSSNQSSPNPSQEQPGEKISLQFLSSLFSPSFLFPINSPSSPHSISHLLASVYPSLSPHISPSLLSSSFSPQLPGMTHLLSSFFTVHVSQLIASFLQSVLVHQYVTTLSVYVFARYRHHMSSPEHLIKTCRFVSRDIALKCMEWIKTYQLQSYWFDSVTSRHMTGVLSTYITDIRSLPGNLKVFGLSNTLPDIVLTSCQTEIQLYLHLLSTLSYYGQYYALVHAIEQCTVVKNRPVQIQNTLAAFPSVKHSSALFPLIDPYIVNAIYSSSAMQIWYRYLHQYCTVSSAIVSLMIQYEDIFTPSVYPLISNVFSGSSRNIFRRNLSPHDDTVDTNQDDEDDESSQPITSVSSQVLWKTNLTIRTPFCPMKTISHNDEDTISSQHHTRKKERAVEPTSTSTSTGSDTTESQIHCQLQITSLPSFSGRQTVCNLISAALTQHVISSIFPIIFPGTILDSLDESSKHELLEHMYINLAYIPWIWLLIPVFKTAVKSSSSSILRSLSIDWISLHSSHVQLGSVHSPIHFGSIKSSPNDSTISDDSTSFPQPSSPSKPQSSSSPSFSPSFQFLPGIDLTTFVHPFVHTQSFAFLHEIIFHPQHGYLLPIASFFTFLSPYIESCLVLASSQFIFSQQAKPHLLLETTGRGIEKLLNSMRANINISRLKRLPAIPSVNALLNTVCAETVNAFSDFPLSHFPPMEPINDVLQALPTSSTSPTIASPQPIPSSAKPHSVSVFALPWLFSRLSARLSITPSEPQPKSESKQQPSLEPAHDSLSVVSPPLKFDSSMYRLLTSRILSSKWVIALLTSGLAPMHIISLQSTQFDGGTFQLELDTQREQASLERHVETFIGTQTLNVQCPNCSRSEQVFSYPLSLPQSSMKTDIYGSEDVWSERCTCKSCGHQWTIRH